MLPSFDNGAIQCYNELLLNRSLGTINVETGTLANSDYVSIGIVVGIYRTFISGKISTKTAGCRF